MSDSPNRKKNKKKKEKQRVVSQKQYDDLLSSFHSFRDDDDGNKVSYSARNIPLLDLFFLTPLSIPFLKVKIFICSKET